MLIGGRPAKTATRPRPAAARRTAASREGLRTPPVPVPPDVLHIAQRLIRDPGNYCDQTDDGDQGVHAPTPPRPAGSRRMASPLVPPARGRARETAHPRRRGSPPPA